jgi:uncharacterized protein YdeI (YjbR/CyaY-like superfamily)
VAKHDAYPEEKFATAAKFDAWLRKNHDSADGVWLVFAKKAAPERTITYAEAVEVALCWGWIDGQGKGLDEHFTRVKFTPRAKRSRWSKINRQHAERLIKEKRMQPPGLAEVERAKADGRWAAAYDSPSTATVPDDLAAALKKNKQAAAFFATLNSRNRYAILYRVNDAKKPETRAARIEKFVTMLAEGKTLF